MRILMLLPLLIGCNSPETNVTLSPAFMSNTSNNDSIVKNDTTNITLAEAAKSLPIAAVEKKSLTKTDNSVADSFNLKNVLSKRGIKFGTVLTGQDVNQLPPRPKDYLDKIAGYFDYYTMSISFKIVENKQGVFDFSSPDKIVEFAKSHGAKVKGHALVLSSSLPDWLTKGKYSPEELQSILKTHVQTIVKHFKEKYPGMVTDWNVVNEAVCNDGQDKNPEFCFADAGIEKNIWTVIHKPNSNDPTDYIQLAFEWAREIDPTAKLYLNENRLEMNNRQKKERAYNLVAHLKQKGTPIDGIGFQCHIRLYEKNSYSVDGLTNIMNQFASLGLETQVSEFDVMLASGADRSTSPSTPIPIDNPTQKDLQDQADLYKMFLKACLKTKNCKGFTVWGAWDESSWTNQHWKGAFQPHILNKDMKPKMTFQGLENATEND